MKIMQETTIWEGETGPNHIYVFEDYVGRARLVRAIAFSAFGTEPVQRFRKPITLDLKGRTFEKVK